MTTKRLSPAELERKLDRILLKVDKPARYAGVEFNTTLKPEEEIEVRLALAFPDVYDIGMSYHGFKIFYERINRIQGLQCERVFAPWPDFEAQMRAEEIPLYLLESKRPLSDADVIGFTLQHEMNYTNLLNMMDLGGVPVFSKDRGENAPIVIAGGHGAFNPEVLGDYLDVIVIGDGEWALVQVLETVRTAKRLRAEAAWNAPAEEDLQKLLSDCDNYHYRGDGTVAKRKAVPTFDNANMEMPGRWRVFENVRPGGPNREDILLNLAKIPGVYVPRFYEPQWNEDGTTSSIKRTRDDVPEIVTKSNFDVRDDYGCTRPVVPVMRVVHDRFAIEIKRGCMVGCRFCQAGMISRPLRERDPRQIVEIAREGIRNTGYDEISLLSLSSADYSGILELTRALRNELADENVSVSLPSLRINAFDVDLADEIGSVRKSGFTFAPEAGTARLREVINKAVDEQRFHDTIESVLSKGWRTLKFYFMCGLPTETDEDLQGIVDLTNKAIELGKKHCGNNFQLNISLSPFIPKPQTPFQWHAQPTIEEFDRKYQYVQSRINRKYVSLKKHSLKESIIEGVLGRGDRRVGRAIHRAWQLGCKFDNWHEHLNFDSWQQAFRDTGIDPYFYASRERGKDEVLPWDHVDASLGKKFLWKEKTKSELVKTTSDCSTTHCVTCEVCDFKEVKNLLSVREDGEYFAPALKEKTQRSNEPIQRVRLTFAKRGMLRFCSHLDILKAMQLIFKRSGLRIAYSQGFNPVPKMIFTPPLPMGFGSESELLDVVFTESYDRHEALERLREIKLDGLEWLAIEEVPLRSPAIGAILESADYDVWLESSQHDVTETLVNESVARWSGADTLPIEAAGRNKMVQRDLKQTVTHFTAEKQEDGFRFSLRVSLKEQAYMNPVTALAHLLGITLDGNPRASRTAVKLETEPAASI